MSKKLKIGIFVVIAFVSILGICIFTKSTTKLDNVDSLMEIYFEGNDKLSEYDKTVYTQEVSTMGMLDSESYQNSHGSEESYVEDLGVWEPISIFFEDDETGKEVTLTGLQKVWQGFVSDLDWVCGDDYSFRVTRETVLTQENLKSAYEYTGYSIVDVYDKEGNLLNTYRAETISVSK